jgi:hypothetical protein
MGATLLNRRIVLARLPQGAPVAADFRIEDGAAGVPAAGEVLLRTLWLSLDPYQRNWMAGGGNYGAAAAPGVTVIGRAVSEVLDSADARFAPGDRVLGETGWQSHPLVRADALERIDPGIDPPSAVLGVLGSPGLTAWIGIEDILQPRAGETVVVSAALGAVGSVAGQLARMRGARVVGIAGDAQKCRVAVTELGYHACVARREDDLAGRLAQVCPAGVDAFFDNTGGAVAEAVYALLRQDARIALCGLVAEYGQADARGPSLKPLLARQATLRAFSVRRHLARMAEYRSAALGWVRSGTLRHREHVVDGIESAPRAFADLLSGATLGKALVRVHAPTGAAELRQDQAHAPA